LWDLRKKTKNTSFGRLFELLEIARADVVTFELIPAALPFPLAKSIRVNSLKSGMMAKGTTFVSIPTQEFRAESKELRPQRILRSVMNPVPLPFTFKEGVLMAVERALKTKFHHPE
jgi:hypothetical protein